MPISCAASVQAPFERGIALLHSFWYEEALKQFRSVAAADPQCAMAHWAIAMTGFAHKQDEQAFQQISAAADMQDRVGQAEVDIPAREMYADMLLADNRPAESLVQYRTALRLSPNRFNALYNAGLAAEATGRPAEALAFISNC
jgi:tetratricopeptide (TPR) repeat protein